MIVVGFCTTVYINEFHQVVANYTRQYGYIGRGGIRNGSVFNVFFIMSEVVPINYMYLCKHSL